MLDIQKVFFVLPSIISMLLIFMLSYSTKIASKIARTYTDKHGLKDLVKEIIGVEMSKQMQSSDWGAEKLSEKQLKYAATDCIFLHQLKNWQFLLFISIQNLVVSVFLHRKQIWLCLLYFQSKEKYFSLGFEIL